MMLGKSITPAMLYVCTLYTLAYAVDTCAYYLGLDTSVQTGRLYLGMVGGPR